MADIFMAKKADKKLERKLTERVISGEISKAQAQAAWKRALAAEAGEKQKKKAKKALKAAKKRVSPKVIKKAQAGFDEAREREIDNSWDLEDALRVQIPGEFVGKAAALKKSKVTPTCSGHSSEAYRATCMVCKTNPVQMQDSFTGEIQKNWKLAGHRGHGLLDEYIMSHSSEVNPDDVWMMKNATNPVDRERAFERLLPGFDESRGGFKAPKSNAESRVIRQLDRFARTSENPAEREMSRNAAEDIRVNGCDASALTAVTDYDRARLIGGGSAYAQ